MICTVQVVGPFLDMGALGYCDSFIKHYIYSLHSLILTTHTALSVHFDIYTLINISNTSIRNSYMKLCAYCQGDIIAEL